ncbi:MAG: response regulator [Thermoplasmata archaeon]|nr:response regulator [Thermoplasmata archaeon]
MSTPENSAGEVTASTAVVVAGDQETRVLLRGLLRLHHYRVLGEAEGSTQALELVRSHHPAVLLADVNLAEGSFTSLLEASRRADPRLRVILVAPASRPHTATAGGPHADAVLFRPFRIRQFAEALTPPGPAAAEAASPT